MTMTPGQPSLGFTAHSTLMAASNRQQMGAHAFRRASRLDHTMADVPPSQRIDIGRLDRGRQHRPQTHSKQIREQRWMSRAGLVSTELSTRAEGGLRRQ